MTHLPEVLEVMENDNGTAKKQDRILKVPFLLVICISTIFMLSLLVSVFLFHKYMTCDTDLLARMSGPLDETDLKTLVREMHPDHAMVDVRLPRYVMPESYKIKIIPFIWPGNFTFIGQVEITLNVTEVTSVVTLHAHNLNISSYRISEILKPFEDEAGAEREVPILHTYDIPEKQFFVIETMRDLSDKYKYKLAINYTGIINDNLQGFYRSSYKVGDTVRWIAVTQFQATDARQAFPCFDEPSFKAKFTLSIARPFNMTALSNMPVAERETRTDIPSNYILDTFKESVPMSTYLVAFAVTDFHELSDKRIHVWARKEAIDQAKYALTIGSNVLTFFIRYFQIDFPLPKMDMIALPDFGSGAMENWGLITFRETAMLYKEGVSTRYNKESVATVVAHELAHQWFGNLVTPEWWSDLWLNEGFATYMEYIAIDAVEPDWKILDQFVVDELQSVLFTDALISSHPISVEVSHPDEINEIFDGISYSKGASIIRMMDHFLTTEVFKRGLTNYINKNAYKNSAQDHLWSSLTAEAQKSGILDNTTSVKQIMDTWTLQTGYPVITVTRHYINNSVSIKQSRYVLNPDNKTFDHSLWWVPLTYTTSDNPNFENTRPSYWLKAEPEIMIEYIDITPARWLIFNVKQTGFYRVNYDAQNWKLLIATLNNPDTFHTIDPVNRAQLLNDAMMLANSGLLEYSVAFDVTLYLQYELEYVPWTAAFSVFHYINDMLKLSSSYDKFKTYMLFLSTKLYQDTGFFEKSSDDQLRIYKRVEVVGQSCKLGLEDCVRNAVNQFQSWRLTPQPDINNPISPNLKSTVYCTAIRIGGQKEWDFAWQRYLKANVGSEKDILLSAMGCTRETWILTRYLEWALNESSGIRKQDVIRVFSSVSSNVIGRPLAWTILRDQWERVVKYLGPSLYGLSSIVKAVLSGANTEYELREIVDFTIRHKNSTGSASRALLQSIEKTRSNVNWMNKNYNNIVTWLENTVSLLPITDNIV